VLRFSLSVALRQLTGISLIVVLASRRATNEVLDPRGWWAAFMVAVILLAPEVVDSLVKAWKVWRGNE
jgi:hypothetical protein